MIKWEEVKVIFADFMSNPFRTIFLLILFCFFAYWIAYLVAAGKTDGQGGLSDWLSGWWFYLTTTSEQSPVDCGDLYETSLEKWIEKC